MFAALTDSKEFFDKFPNRSWRDCNNLEVQNTILLPETVANTIGNTFATSTGLRDSCLSTSK